MTEPIRRLSRKDAIRTLTHFENVLPPAEFLRRQQIAIKEENTHLAAAFARSSVTAFLKGQTPEPYWHEALSKEFRVYSGRSGARACLVIFSTGIVRPGLPTTGLLQVFPAADWDVILLADHWAHQFRDGLRGFGRTGGELFDHLARRLKGYDRIEVLGVSHGGIAALAFARAVGDRPSRVVSFGPLPPWDIRRLLTGMKPPAFLPVCDCLKTRLPDAVILAARSEPRDLQVAQLLASQTGATVVAAPPPHAHNVIGQFWTAGQLADYAAIIRAGGAHADRVAALRRLVTLADCPEDAGAQPVPQSGR